MSDARAIFGRKDTRHFKCLRSDDGGEYVSKAFQAFCDSKGIKRELTAPYNPPQNEVVERMNQIIQDRVHTMLSHVALPHGFVQILL